jgi:hypothetical protein
MAAETQYTANTGMVTISATNSALDGSGSLSTVLTGASNGTLVKTVTIKAAYSTTGGMVRLFCCDASNKRIIAEVDIPAVTCASTTPTFETTLDLDYFIASGGILKATTEMSGTFYINIIAEGLDFSYYGASYRPESTKYEANTGFATLTTANTALDGTGTLGTDIWNVLTAADNGTIIQSVIIKAQVTTTAGMVRLFLYDGSNTKLFKEIHVPAISKESGAAPNRVVTNSFSYKIDFNGRDFALKSGWSLRATTQNSEAFNVIAEGLNWEYPA